MSILNPVFYLLFPIKASCSVSFDTYVFPTFSQSRFLALSVLDPVFSILFLNRGFLLCQFWIRCFLSIEERFQPY